MPENRVLPTCAICGKRQATTAEHVPPKTLFLKPRPSNLVTVPACFFCNNRSSAIEEQFGVYLAMLVAHPAERTWSLWRNQALRTIRHNRRLFQKLHTNVRTVSVQSPGGIHLGEAASFPVPGTVYNSVIEKTIRGLYYHHYGETLGDRAVVAASMYRGLTEEMKTNTEMLSQNDIGKGVFLERTPGSGHSVRSCRCPVLADRRRCARWKGARC
jgi:hypothetical protein